MNHTPDTVATVASLVNITNDLDYPTGQRDGKAFATVVPRFALACWLPTDPHRPE